VVFTAIAYSILWLMSALVTEIIIKIKKPSASQPTPQNERRLPWIPVKWAFPAGLVGGFFALWMTNIFSSLRPGLDHSVWYLLTFGVPLTAVLVLIVGVIHLGIIGRNYDDLLREWWGRLGGLILAVTACWCLVCVATLFLPLWLRLFWLLLHSENHGWITKMWQTLAALGVTATAGGWVTATFKGLLAAKGRQTGPSVDGQLNSPSNHADLLARIAPPLFTVGLMGILSWLLYFIVPAIEGISHGGNYWEVVSDSTWWAVLLAAIGLFTVSRLMGTRVDVNEFSLHNAYRNRLVRCYLGATHPDRNPQPFTGFNENDNVSLRGLDGLGAPFHILNATLNVTKGKELALQARKARSFVFTPLYSGFDYTEDVSTTRMPGRIRSETEVIDTVDAHVKKQGAYRLTENLSRLSLFPGARLGTAMAISGAAVSPNMGHYSTGSVSFLLTIFSVRLGWWLGNPRDKKYWESKKPRSSWKALMRELTGSTNEDQSEVYLSDGGHFDNLGVYELVRRRCRLIIACDAGADASYACNDLSSVIEKCRVDFHAEITINLDDIRPGAQAPLNEQGIRVSKKPFAVGSILYPNHRQGTLIYIKSSLIADLPQDVLAYARAAEAFPHESTVDQFFDETQFESYRSIGFACASAAVQAIQSEM
jgi:hypothetical protein